MKKFYYAFFVLVFGFSSAAVLSNFSAPAIAFASGHHKFVHGSTHTSSNHYSSHSDDNNGDNDDSSSDDTDNGHDGDQAGTDDHGDYSDNDSHDGDYSHGGGSTPSTATIVATKIICDDESDLPNWGEGGPNITSSTASHFLSDHENCHEDSDWTFQWAPNGTSNPGDQDEEGGADWTPFEGSTTIPAGALIWVREEANDSYIPFSGWISGGNNTPTAEDEVSAEIYCNSDVLNYDNYDWINPVVAGKTYNCVAFNVPKESDHDNQKPIADAGPDQTITLPTNTVTLDGSGSTDPDGTIVSYEWTMVSGPSDVNPDDTVGPTIDGLVEGTYVFQLTVTDDCGCSDFDTVTITVNPADNGGGSDTFECSDSIDNDGDAKIDATDPGCHTDSNPNNPDSYVPTDDDESDFQCSNTIDDDGDAKIDAADPGCHTDGNVDNPDSYVPTDNDETDDGQGGGGDDSFQCSDLVDNDGDELIDANDPGCHSDGNEGNPDSYVPTDDDETNDNGGGGGGGSHSHHSGGGRTVGQVLSAENTCGIYVTEYLRVGYANDVETVKKVQSFLNDFMQSGLVVDGIYGVKTEAAVRAFQATRNTNVLTPWGISDTTGIFYLTTQTEVNNIMCPTLGLPIPAPLVNWSQNGAGNLPGHIAGEVAGAQDTKDPIYTSPSTSNDNVGHPVGVSI